MKKIDVEEEKIQEKNDKWIQILQMREPTNFVKKGIRLISLSL